MFGRNWLRGLATPDSCDWSSARYQNWQHEQLIGIRLNGVLNSVVVDPVSRRVACDSDDKLAEIAPLQEPDEGFRCILQPVNDVFTITQLTSCEPFTRLVVKSVALAGELPLDETTDLQALRQNRPHGIG
ncbi:hypothetical protein At12D1_21750 [Agrobacterium tumefaciens]|nr:hypothetical protein At12D1_21750 [Agrobacterium tumefaciens]